jgi:hypothetical protein
MTKSIIYVIKSNKVKIVPLERNVAHASQEASRESVELVSFAPSELDRYPVLHPRLAPWGLFLRRFAAGSSSCQDLKNRGFTATRCMRERYEVAVRVPFTLGWLLCWKWRAS